MNKAFLILVVLLAGCSRPVTPADIVLAEELCSKHGGILRMKGLSPTDFMRILCKDGLLVDATMTEVSK